MWALRRVEKPGGRMSELTYEKLRDAVAGGHANAIGPQS